MVPSSALRETIILIIFGVVLVPIAAKRAQDTPGYWQTFSKELSSLSYDGSDPTWPSDLAVLRIDDLDKSTPAASQVYIKSNETVPVVYPTRSAPQTDTRAALTIHFHVVSAEETVDAPTTEAESFKAPQATPPPSASSTIGQESAAADTLVAKASEAPEASKGRWTLIWMGSAITAVAMFMARC